MAAGGVSLSPEGLAVPSTGGQTEPGQPRAMAYQISRYVETADASDGRSTLVFSTKTGRLVRVDKMRWGKLLQRAGRIDTGEGDESLVDAGVLVPENSDEFESLHELSRVTALAPQMLSRTIIPSALCQLACGY